MIGWISTLAHPSPVVCDPTQAARIVEEAHIEAPRIPITHPELVPGLAREGADPELAAALDRLCAPGAELSVDRGPRWTSAGQAAYTVRATRTMEDGCSLVQERVEISVGTSDQGITYRLLDRPPIESTPLDQTCAEPVRLREQRRLDGDQGRVRVLLNVDLLGDQVASSAVELRRADGEGWSRQVVQNPASGRYLEPDGGGPQVALGHTRTGQPVVVMSHDRTAPPCSGRGGQSVWTWSASEWVERSGRDALLFLAEAGLWRLAGDAGWMLILAQDDEADAPLLDPRRRRLQRRDSEDLFVFTSADFPGLNAGFLVIAPAPWPTEAEARAARPRWRRGAYVKRAWAAPDPCPAP